MRRPVPAVAPGDIDHDRAVGILMRRAELAAERTIALVRIAVAVVLLVFFVGAGRRAAADPDGMMGDVIIAARAGVLVFVVTGVLALVLLRLGRFRDWMGWVFATADVVIITRAIQVTLERTELTGNFLVLLPPVWAAPLMLAVGALRYRPLLQLYTTVLMAAAFVYLSIDAGFKPRPDLPLPDEAGLFLSMRPSLMRLAMLLMMGLVTALAMWRARNLLKLVASETLSRATLTRFLPAEVAPIVASDRFAELRRGRRQTAVTLFVDIRDFTHRAEDMDPHRLSIFVAAFRRRVTRAANAHHGVIDKFVGDGAMVIFGLPEPRADDAARALACAADIRVLIARWNAKRGFEPPVEVGIGVHMGEVFCGVVGDSERLEFTVLGDAVNVGARLEQATKVHHLPILASADVVRAAGALEAWREVAREPLRGRAGEIIVMTPRELPAPAALSDQRSAPSVVSSTV